MASPSSSSNTNNNTFTSFPIAITESLFGSAWNNSWLPHPTRDVQSSLYPWTEDAARDFVLQTALALCCGARPSPSAASFNLSQLTPVNGQPAPLAPGQSPLAFYFASETPSVKQRTQEEGLIKMFMLELIESKNQQFQEQQQQQQQQQNEQVATTSLSQDGESQAVVVVEDVDDLSSNKLQQSKLTKKTLRQLPPLLSTKDICQGLLPSAFWMNCNVLHPIAVSCAWRTAFAVELLDEQFQEAQILVRRELFSSSEYDWSSSIEQEKQEDESENKLQKPGNEAIAVSSSSFLKTNTSLLGLEETNDKEEVRAKNTHENKIDDAEDDAASSSPNSIWKTIYESALEDRSMAATHIRGIISRKLTLDRFSVRELHFIWQLFCGPRSTALRWFRKWNKNISASSEINNINNNNNQSQNLSGGAQSPSLSKEKGNVSSSSASPASNGVSLSPGGFSLGNNNNIGINQVLLHPSNITLNYCSACFPPHVSFLFTPLALHCVVKKDSLMMELRALYFGVLEQHGIGKERRVIGNANNNNNIPTVETGNLDITASSSASKNQSNVDGAEKNDKNSQDDAYFVIPTTTTKTVKPTGKVSKNSTTKQLVSFADDKQKKVGDEDDVVRTEMTTKTSRSRNNKNNAISEETTSSTKNQAPARRTRGGKAELPVSAALRETDDDDDDDSDQQDEAPSGKANSKSQSNLPRKKLTASASNTAVVNKSDSAVKSAAATTPTINNAPSNKNIIPQLTTNYGFFFNDTNQPLQPFYDQQQQHQNSNNINQMKNQSGNNYSLRSQRTQQNQNNNCGDFSGNLGDSSSQKQKPEMELSSAADTNNIVHPNNNATNMFIIPGQQQSHNHDEVENTNATHATSKIPSQLPITQISAPPLVDENNFQKNSGQVDSAPRHSSAVWQLVTNFPSSKDNENCTPDMWKEYYSRCFDLIAQSGLKMKNAEYMRKVL